MSTKKATERATLLAQLAQPTSAYKRRVWLAVAGLVVFITLYLVLAGWFIDTAYRLTIGADEAVFAGYVVGGCALFLAILMLKPVLYVSHGGTEGSVEITEEQQPRLFTFLHELADAAEAPRPHRVFLSPIVNASVFYDLSAMNLLFPSKKNLEIGLALVNSLTLGELRAVLAHEFGHFTQRSMAVMRWAYLAQQIAAHVVHRRDKLDELLVKLSHLDVRVAWLGWLLSIVVWSIRSLVDSAFGVLLILQRALSREMEFQADLIAVALTGSDALIHALHRMQAADDSWERTLSLVSIQQAKERIPSDVFALHARVMERMGSILSDPDYGHVPPVPAERADKHRLFKPELAQPPKMWLTHPLNHDREENAKRRYVRAQMDDSSSWTLFDNADGVRTQVSAVMLGSEGKPTVSIDESLAALDEQFGRQYLNTEYRGVYLGRSVARSAARAQDLADSSYPGWREQLDQLYPESLIDDVARLRTLEKELGQLQAIASGFLTPAEGIIRHRGRAIKRRDLPQVIKRVEHEVAAVERRLASGDRMRRSIHLAAAASLGNGWARYLDGLHAVLHYADHTASNLRDLQQLLGHTAHIATVTRRVSSAGRKRVLEMANELHRALTDVYAQSGAVVLDSTLLQRLSVGSWSEGLGTLELGSAVEENLGDWMGVIDGWMDHVASACSGLRMDALEQLLHTEAAIAAHVKRGTVPEAAPSPSRIPEKYPVLLTGKERERASSLNWWQRFQIADGPVPAVARVLAAAAIVAAVLGFSGTVGTATVTVYNGLSVPVVVNIGGQELPVGALGTVTREVDATVAYRVETRTRQGTMIEAFTPEVAGSFAHFFYNVGGVTPLVEWTAVYGNGTPRPERYLGAPRWGTSSAHVLFGDAPDSVDASSGGAVRRILSGLGDAPPARQLSLLATEDDRQRVLKAHLQWDATASPNILSWVAAAKAVLPDYQQVFEARLAQLPNDVLLLRLEQDAATGDAKDSVCARHTAKAASEPDNGDLQYLSRRCIRNETTKAQAFASGHARWPDNGWFAYAAGYDATEVGDWPKALEALEVARRQLRPLSAHVAVDLARIRRLIDQDSANVMASLGKSSDELEYLMSLEKGGEMKSTHERAYLALAQGHLDKALRIAQRDSEVEAEVLRFAAVSDGASPEIQARALALDPARGLDETTRWSAIALAVRTGREYAPLLDSALSLTPDRVEHLQRFITLVRTAKDLNAAEEALTGLPPSLRGHGYSMGVAILGAKTPDGWRRAAKRLLFASERPYFK